MDPIIQNDPAYEALLALDLEVVDAQHVFVAVKQKCNIFLTCDRHVRDRAAAVKDQFELIVQKPSEFLRAKDGEIEQMARRGESWYRNRHRVPDHRKVRVERDAAELRPARLYPA